MSFHSLRSTAPQPTMVALLLVIFIASPTLAQWSAPVRISEPGDCWDPQIIASGDTLHVVYENTGAGYDKISYVRSTDAGLSWSEPIRLTERRGSTVFPRIMENGSQLMVVWEQVFDSGYDRYNVGYAISGDDGASWDSAHYIFNPNWAGIQSMVAAGTGPLAEVIVGTQVGYDFVFYESHSTDFGQTWSDTNVIFTCYDAGKPDIAEMDSVIHFVWDGRFEAGPPWDIYYKRSLDGGSTWSENLMLSTFDEHGSQEPTISLGGSNAVAVDWADGKYSPYMLTGDVLMRVSGDTGTTWGSETQATFNYFVLKSDVAIRGDTIDAVWMDLSIGLGRASIYETSSHDGGAFWSEPIRLDVTDHDSHDPAIINSQGRKYVVWADALYPPESSGVFISRWPGEPDAVDDTRDMDFPDKIELSAYPNPFNSNVTISLYSEKGGEVNIYDDNGRLIRSLFVKPGNQKTTWDRRGVNGEDLSSSVFFVEFESGGHSKSMKLVYVK